MTSSMRTAKTAQRRNDAAFSCSVPVSSNCERVQSANICMNGRTSERHWTRLLGIPIALAWVLVLGVVLLREDVER